MQLTLNPGIGLGTLVFGMTKNETKKKLGEPSEIEPADSDELEYWHYDDAEISVAFDGSENWRLSTVVCSNAELNLFGIKIIGANRKVLIDLLQKKGFKKLSFDESVEGEMHTETIESEELEMLFWLQDGDVTEIQFGPFFTDEATINWPV